MSRFVIVMLPLREGRDSSCYLRLEHGHYVFAAREGASSFPSAKLAEKVRVDISQMRHHPGAFLNLTRVEEV